MPDTIDIRLNGRPHVAPAGASVAALLDSLGLSGQPVLVEHCSQALFPRQFSETVLAAGDEVEVIRIVAGG